MMLATIVDTQALLKTVAASAIAGVGVTLIFSVAILGATRFVEQSREGLSVQALAFGILALVALTAAAAAVTIGIIVMSSK
jgi:hypothetical protein